MIISRSKNKQASSPEAAPASYLPVISIFMPFEPKMVRKADLASRLLLLKQQAELQINRDFFVSDRQKLLDRLNAVIANINYSTHKKSIAIYVSAEAEKIFYLDMPVSEKVMVTYSYNIRSLVDCKKELQPFLVLAIDECSSRICSGVNGALSTIISNHTFLNPDGDKTNDSSQLFLAQVDRGLSIILSSFPCPLIIIGSQEILNQFKAVTKNNSRICEIILCGSNDLSEANIRVLIQPCIANWKKLRHKYLLQKLHDASFIKKIAVGISHVLRIAKQKRGEFLVVERNYTYPVINADNDKIDPIKKTPSGTKFTDLVDETIEAVLENGGDVEFVDREFLDKFMHVALLHR